MSICCTVLALTLALQIAKPFVSAEGGFEVKLPGIPSEQVQKHETPKGPIEIHTFLLPRGTHTYAIVYNDLPDLNSQKAIDEMFAGVMDGILRSTKGKLISQKAAKLGTVLGRHFDYSVTLPAGGAGLGRVRMYADKGRVFQVFVIGEIKAVKSAASTAFLDSFKIDPTRKASAVKGNGKSGVN